jgi:hypothetical protein
MTRSAATSYWLGLTHLGCRLLFFLIFFLYTWQQIDPVLQHHVLAPVFFTGPDFFQEFKSYPGGLTEYAAALLMQLYVVPWLGALISTLVAVLTFWASRQLLSAMGERPAQLLPLVPPTLLLMLQHQYEFPWLSNNLALLGPLIATVIYVRRPWTSGWLRLGLFWLLAAPLYYAVAGPCLLYAVLAGIYELLIRQRRLLGIALLLSAALLPFVTANFIFMMPWADAYTGSLPFLSNADAGLLAGALYLCLPLAVLGMTLSGHLNQRLLRPDASGLAAASAAGSPSQRTPPARGSFALRTWGKARQLPRSWLGSSFLFLMLAALAVGWSHDGHAKAKARTDYYAHRRQWTQLLQEIPRLRQYSPATISDINRALCHLGRLPYDMFAYPQRQGLELWLYLHENLDRRECLKASDLLFELGQVNRAERMASEAMELNGYRPTILQRLALINVLKGEPQAARLFLSRLEKTLGYRAWAAHYRRHLQADPTLSSDLELQRIRPLMIVEDYVGDYTTEPLLQQLLRRNRRNRMAFEYLIAHYLLTSNLEKVVQNVGRLSDFDYPDIPRHVEEALLLYQKMQPAQSINLAGRKINPQTAGRFQQFHQRFMSYGGNLEAAQAGLLKDYGDTYWFYYMFGWSGRYYASAVAQGKNEAVPPNP